MAIINAYTIQPQDIQEGDVMLFVIKAMVMRRGADGKLLYRLYRCPYEGDDVPQGAQIGDMKGVCAQLFPSLAAVGRPE